MHEALNRQLPWDINPPPGGVSIWLEGPPGLDCLELSMRALERGVVIERGDIYFTDPAANLHHLRLGFAALAPGSIEPGVVILGELIRQQLDG